MATDLSKPDLSMPPLEMGKLTHERSGNICVELAIEEHRPLGRFQPWCNPLQILERTYCFGFKTKALSNWCKVDVRKDRLADGLLTKLQEVQLGAVGAVIH